MTSNLMKMAAPKTRLSPRRGRPLGRWVARVRGLGELGENPVSHGVLRSPEAIPLRGLNRRM